MKRLIIITLVLMLAATAMGQDSPIDKGSWSIGGSASFMSQSGDMWESMNGDALTTLQFTPTLGYFVSPGILIGAVANITKLKQGDNELNQSAIGPVIGYYFANSATEVKGALYPHIRLMLLLESLGNENDSDNSTSFGASLGADYMLTNSVSLNFGVIYLANSWTPDGASESITGSTISFGVGIGTFIY